MQQLHRPAHAAAAALAGGLARAHLAHLDPAAQAAESGPEMPRSSVRSSARIGAARRGGRRRRPRPRPVARSRCRARAGRRERRASPCGRVRGSPSRAPRPRASHGARSGAARVARRARARDCPSRRGRSRVRGTSGRSRARSSQVEPVRVEAVHLPARREDDVHSPGHFGPLSEPARDGLAFACSGPGSSQTRGRGLEREGRGDCQLQRRRDVARGLEAARGERFRTGRRILLERRSGGPSVPARHRLPAYAARTSRYQRDERLDGRPRLLDVAARPGGAWRAPRPRA